MNMLLFIAPAAGGKAQRYAWNGSRIVAINQDLLNEGFTAAGRLQDFLSGVRQRVRSSFVPRKEDVTDDYWEWLKWRLGQVCREGGGAFVWSACTLAALRCALSGRAHPLMLPGSTDCRRTDACAAAAAHCSLLLHRHSVPLCPSHQHHPR